MRLLIVLAIASPTFGGARSTAEGGAEPIEIAAPVAHADRDMCARGTIYRGATIDLDVKGADVHDVFRLLSDVGRINLAMSNDVAGKVTLKLKRVPWDQVACTVAAVQGLAITLQGNVMLVSRRPRPSS